MAPAAQQPARVPSAEDIRSATNAAVACLGAIQELRATCGWLRDFPEVNPPYAASCEQVSELLQTFRGHFQRMECVEASTQTAIFQAKDDRTTSTSQVMACGIAYPIGFNVALDIAGKFDRWLDLVQEIDRSPKELAALLVKWVPPMGRAFDNDELARLKAVIMAEGANAEAMYGGADPPGCAAGGEIVVKDATASVPAIPRKPSKKAFMAWQLFNVVRVGTQTEVATMMIKNEHTASQGSVSRWIKEVEEYRKAGGIMPAIEQRKPAESIDPSKIDMGAHRENRPKRQRFRAAEDSDD